MTRLRGILKRLRRSPESMSSRRLDEQHAQQIQLKDAVAAEADSRNVPDPEYTRPPDRTILRLGCQVSVAKSEIKAMCDEWLSPLPLDSWYLTGPDTGEKFVLGFKALTSSAATQASKARKLLQ
eukprot:5283083-Karenia_brevis.AAC.1